MFEKVNPSHPDKIADRIAGAMVDLAYRVQENPKVAVEVLIGHGECTIIAESSVSFSEKDVKEIVERIAGNGIEVRLLSVPQDAHLAENQNDAIRCGDNGIFCGNVLTDEEIELGVLASEVYEKYPTDGKYIIDSENRKFILCQSCCPSDELVNFVNDRYVGYDVVVNPLGDWIGGTDVDTGCTNRKLGSDMGRSVTGGGLHGKDISKADVSVNIYAFLQAQRTGRKQEFCCAIGDSNVGGVPYEEIVKTAKDYIDSIGGFEAFAEWGLV